MAIINTPGAGVSPYETTTTAPTVLRAGADGSTVLATPAAAAATVSELAATGANTSVYVSGQAALNSLITSSQPGVFDGANVTINLEEQNFNTTNQVTSNTNYPSGNTGEIQFNSGANSFTSDPYFTYSSSNVVTPGIRTNGYFYANGSPFIGGGNAAIGNFVFTGDTMSISDDANISLTIQGNSLGNNLNQIIINPTSVDLYAFNTSPYSYSELYLDNGNTEAPYAQIIVDGNSTPQQTWTFDALGNTTFPTGGTISNYPGGTGANNDSWFVTPNNGTGGVSSQDGQQYIQINDDLFVEIGTSYGTANASAWTFGRDGNLTLPGNTIAINYANGNRITGNVTFRNEIVIGTGTSNLISGLYLAPSSSSANANMYLRVRGNIVDEPTHIHFDTGNNSYYNQFIGDDNKYIQLANTGNIVINSNDNVGNSAQWTFAANGTTQFPGNLLQAPAGNPLDIKVTNGNAYSTVSLYDGGSQLIIQDNTTGPNPAWALFEADLANVNTPQAVVILKPGDTGNEVRWTFDALGNLSLPGNTFAVNYANGNPVVISGGNANTGNVTFDNQAVVGTGDQTGGGGLYLAPGNASVGNVQYLRVRGGDYPTHIHLDTGNNQYFDQYFGDDNKYIVLSSEGNIVINSNDLIGNSAQWTFGTDGNLTTPGASGNITGANVISANVFTAPGNVSVTAGGNTWTFLSNGNLVFPGDMFINDGGGNTRIGQDAGSLKLRVGNTASLKLGWNETEGTGTGPTAQIIANGADAGYPGNIVVWTGNQSSTTYAWTFDNSGNLTFPTGNLVIIPDDPAGNIASIVSTDHPLGILSTGANGAAISLWVEDIANIGTSNIAAVYANPVPGSGNVRIAVGTNGGPGPYLWDFQPNGNLTAPGNISTTGNITGVNNISTGTVTLTNGAVIKDTATYAVAFGQDAGLTSQGQEAVAIGHYAGRTSQGNGGVAIGVVAGNVNQGQEAVAIGAGAGRTDQGIQSIAIGSNAGQTSQGNNSIIINAAQGALDQTVANTFTVAPVRNDVANIAEIVFYNATSKEITYGNTLSVAGNITGAYFSGNGSGLTDVTATVPSQTILPTIQTITAIPMLTGYLSGGEGGVEVTVANTIPVTEFGVIVTAGTVSQKYATGSLGNAPGTGNITFTTGTSNQPFTVYAYITSNAGTYYSNAVVGTSGQCLLAGTQIALSDGSHKAIEDITYTDKLLSWDFDRGCYAETTAMWIKRSETGSQYNLLTFSDGTTLRTFDQHRIFNKQAGAFTYPMTDATPIGTITVNEHGQEITLTNKQVIEDTIDYYNVITDYHMNLFSDTVLTSCRFNNIYPITDMKFVKDSRTPRTRAEFANIPDRFFHGLRLTEQTADVDAVEWYVDRLMANEVSTQVELVS